MQSLRLGSFSQASITLLQVITPLHVGTGKGAGVVDLPIQRDSIGLPTIYASSLKGALRATFTKLINKRECVDAVFGSSKMGDQDTYAAAFNPLDAKLLLLPVRSLAGVYTLCTSPLLLQTFLEYLEISNTGSIVQHDVNVKDAVEKVINDLKDQRKGEMLVKQGTEAKLSLPINGKNTTVLADEFTLSPKPSQSVGDLAKGLGLEEDWRLAIIHDDLMVNTLVDRSLLRQTRVALEPNTKTVKSGALWTEENLPPQSLLFTVFFYSDPRTNTDKCEELSSKNGEGVKRLFENHIFSNHGYMVFGGHETVGRGIVKLRKLG